VVKALLQTAKLGAASSEAMETINTQLKEALENSTEEATKVLGIEVLALLMVSSKHFFI
jgi:hypothetical protein